MKKKSVFVNCGGLSLDRDESKKRSKMGVRELRDACERGDLETVKGEIRSGADPKERWCGAAAIHCAAAKCHCSIVKYLIEQCGVGVDEKDKYGQTALHYAAYHGQQAMVKMLMDEFNADDNIKDNNGQTALDRAIEGNNPNSE